MPMKSDMIVAYPAGGQIGMYPVVMTPTDGRNVLECAVYAGPQKIQGIKRRCQKKPMPVESFCTLMSACF